MSKIKAAWDSLPVSLRKAVTDAVETGIAASLAVSFTLPTSVDEAKRTALVVLGAGAGAAIAALRRAVLTYLAEKRA